MLFVGVIALGGFYQNTASLPPRVFAAGALPALLLSIGLVVALPDFIAKLPIGALTLLHVIRIPVEIVLYMLANAGTVPTNMTFEGTNFDIISGISAPFVYYFAFRGGKVNRPLLIAWNIAALLLLVNIVVTAILAFPSPMQQIAFDQPNQAIMYFPFIWLPAIVVPIVFFAHIASLRKLTSDS